MCIVDKNGYRLECTGKVIPHYGVDLATLTAEEFAELKNTKVTMISQMQVKNNIHLMGDKIDALIKKVEAAIKASDRIQKDNTTHIRLCPINKEGVIEIVENWYEEVLEEYYNPDHKRSKRFTQRIIDDIKTYIKDTILTTGNIVGALITITLFFSGIGLIVYFATKLAE